MFPFVSQRYQFPAVASLSLTHLLSHIRAHSLSHSRVRNFINLLYFRQTLTEQGILDNELNRSRDRYQQLTHSRACFRNFPAILSAPIRQRHANAGSPEAAVSATCGSCTCSRQDWRQAIEITNVSAPLVSSTLCNISSAMLTPSALYVSVSRQLPVPSHSDSFLAYVRFYSSR